MKQAFLVVLLMVVALASHCFGQSTASQTDKRVASKTNYTVYEVRGDVKAPRPISTPVPPPPESAPTKKQLKVKISFVVAPDGFVKDVKLLKRSTPDFDKYAINVVSTWKFEPATKDGIPVAVRLETEMHSHQ